MEYLAATALFTGEMVMGLFAASDGVTYLFAIQAGNLLVNGVFKLFLLISVRQGGFLTKTKSASNELEALTNTIGNSG